MITSRIAFAGKQEDDIAISNRDEVMEIQCDTPYAFLWMFKELDIEFQIPSQIPMEIWNRLNVS